MARRSAKKRATTAEVASESTTGTSAAAAPENIETSAAVALEAVDASSTRYFINPAFTILANPAM